MAEEQEPGGADVLGKGVGDDVAGALVLWPNLLEFEEGADMVYFEGYVA
jgi:hypothetical protein